jgi:hypothetical protein
MEITNLPEERDEILQLCKKNHERFYVHGMTGQGASAAARCEQTKLPLPCFSLSLFDSWVLQLLSPPCGPPLVSFISHLQHTTVKAGLI